MLYIPELKYKPNGIPILSYQQIDAWTERLPGVSTETDATDLRQVFSALAGWHFAGRFLSKDGTLLGLAAFRGGTLPVTDQGRRASKDEIIPSRTILIDKALFQDHFEHTFRFVLAHEIGHALMHEKFCSDPENMKKYSLQGEIGIKDNDVWFRHIDENHRLMTEREWIEWQANAFASSLLMPRPIVYKLSDIAKEESGSKLEYANTLNTLMVDVLNVSITAAFYRSKRLGLIGGESVLQKNGVISV